MSSYSKLPFGIIPRYKDLISNSTLIDDNSLYYTDLETQNNKKIDQLSTYYYNPDNLDLSELNEYKKVLIVKDINNKSSRFQSNDPELRIKNNIENKTDSIQSILFELAPGHKLITDSSTLDCSQYINRLTQCNSEKTTINNNLTQCNSEKTTINNNLTQCNSEKTTINNNLTQCNSEKITINNNLTQCNSEKITMINNFNEEKVKLISEIERYIKNNTTKDELIKLLENEKLKIKESKTIVKVEEDEKQKYISIGLGILSFLLIVFIIYYIFLRKNKKYK